MWETIKLFVHLQEIDACSLCWPHMFYWLDIMHLSLEQAGGKPGAAAMAAAQELMKEKHSIFLSR